MRDDRGDQPVAGGRVERAEHTAIRRRRPEPATTLRRALTPPLGRALRAPAALRLALRPPLVHLPREVHVDEPEEGAREQQRRQLKQRPRQIERKCTAPKEELNSEIWGKGVCDIWEKWVSGWRNQIPESAFCEPRCRLDESPVGGWTAVQGSKSQSGVQVEKAQSRESRGE